MRTYAIELRRDKLNEFKIGRISGIIWALTGMPEQEYAWTESEDGTVCTMIFETDADGMCLVHDTIEKWYPGVIISEDD